MTQPLYSQSGIKLSFALLTAEYDLRYLHRRKILTSGERCHLTLLSTFPSCLLSFSLEGSPNETIFMMWLIEKQGKIISATPTHGAIIFYSLIYDEGDVNVSAAFCCCSTKIWKENDRKCFPSFFPPSLESFFCNCFISTVFIMLMTW